ncbi:MAG: hypothetical protein EP348_07260 [Alphaproteobacteria bacterium]|nr:MAG: hypothetical protein EP348_07260 [Alphaproteobacteria bacterium]
MSVVTGKTGDWDILEQEIAGGGSAEEAYLFLADEEEDGANDNFPVHEVLQGCIWRDGATRPHDGPPAGEDAFTMEEEGRRRALDFSERYRGHRGFLDEERELSGI